MPSKKILLILPLLYAPEIFSSITSSTIVPEPRGGLRRLGNISIVCFLQYVSSWNQRFRGCNWSPLLNHILLDPYPSAQVCFHSVPSK